MIFSLSLRRSPSTETSVDDVPLPEGQAPDDPRIDPVAQAHRAPLQALERRFQAGLLVVRQGDDRGDLDGRDPAPFVPGLGSGGDDLRQELQSSVLHEKQDEAEGLDPGARLLEDLADDPGPFTGVQERIRQGPTEVVPACDQGRESPDIPKDTAELGLVRKGPDESPGILPNQRGVFH